MKVAALKAINLEGIDPIVAHQESRGETNDSHSKWGIERKAESGLLVQGKRATETVSIKYSVQVKYR